MKKKRRPSLDRAPWPPATLSWPTCTSRADLQYKSSIYPEHFGLVPGAKPVRQRPRRGLTPSWDGFFASHKALGPAPFDSLQERDTQTLLCADPRIKVYAVQPHQLIYWGPDSSGELMKRTYTPDFAALDRDGQVLIIEVKAKIFSESPKWRLLEPFIREAYETDHGARFLLFTEDQIRAQPRLSNCQIMLRHRPPPDDEAGELAAREVLEDLHGEASLGDVCSELEARGIDERRAFSALMRIALSGEISLDLSQPLSASTRITVEA
jgi:hypothetical protein